LVIYFFGRFSEVYGLYIRNYTAVICLNSISLLGEITTKRLGHAWTQTESCFRRSLISRSLPKRRRRIPWSDFDRWGRGGDETWACHYTPSPRDSHYDGLTIVHDVQNRSFSSRDHGRNNLAPVLLVEFVSRGKTINYAAYCARPSKNCGKT